MYTVSILNQRTGQWQSTTETTLSACVCLTLGLVTQWVISNPIGMNSQYIVCSGNITSKHVLPNIGLCGWAENNKSHPGFVTYLHKNGKKRYQHALRSLLCRWISRMASKTVLPSDDRTQLRHIMRLSDNAFYAQIQSFERRIEQFNHIDCPP